uniref:Uncharacterized protein n=1 Tax=Nelumbo nucifera TaxID=4432 RepID=A0A822YEG7_NELNU|nr:TPA_asm: hypothetical protein HUJ06_009643 [Nelumbo nucifera]
MDVQSFSYEREVLDTGRQSQDGIWYGGTTTTDYYYSYGERVAPSSGVKYEIPRYPNVHLIFNKNKATHHDHHGISGSEEQQVLEPAKANEGSRVLVKKHVHFEQVVDEGNKSAGNHNVYKENIDFKADDFIQQKHKSFSQLSKLLSMKAP